MYGMNYTDIIGQRPGVDQMGGGWQNAWGQPSAPWNNLAPYCPAPPDAGQGYAQVQGQGYAQMGAQGDFGGGFPGNCGVQNPLLVQQFQQGAVGLAPRFPYKIRTEWLGFPRVCIHKCETVKIECTAQVPIKIVRFVISKAVAFGLLIERVQIGKDDLVNCDAIPAEMWTADATDEFNAMIDTIQPGCSVAITLTNVSDDDLCVSIGAICRVVYY
jgi:hypothetical protein